MTDTEQSHPFPDRIIVSGPANEYPTELLEARCELTIVHKGSTFEVVEADGEMLADSRPATREEIAASVELSPAMAHGLALDCEVAKPRFEVGDKIVPGPESQLHGEVGTGEILTRLFGHSRRGWNYIVKFPTRFPAVVMLEERMRPVEHEGWKGTPPAEGTRRALILQAVRDWTHRAPGDVHLGRFAERIPLEITDAIEEAFLAQERGEEASTESAEQPREIRDPAALLASIASFFGGRR